MYIIILFQVNQFWAWYYLCINLRYWGWGGEDDDIFNRLRYKGFHPKHLKGRLGRFKVWLFNIRMDSLEILKSLCCYVYHNIFYNSSRIEHQIIDLYFFVSHCHTNKTKTQMKIGCICCRMEPQEWRKTESIKHNTLWYLKLWLMSLQL